MAYTVLARRYRSGTFDEVIGQDHVAQTLKRAIEANRIAHAYLFTGTRGVGKTSMARILAKALNCLEFDAPTTKPCGKCSSCIAIAKGEDIDVIEIDAASSTGVDNIRDLISNAQFRPARSRFKVYIIDEVHMLSKGAFNALLKIMEEPPEHVKFILATTEVDKILPTILSRCQRYDFRNIPAREIVEHLRMITKEEKVQADEDALALVARAGAGSMRDSLSLLDRLLSVGEKKLTADMIESLLGMPRATAIVGIADAIGNGDVKGTLETAQTIINNGLSADTLIASLIDHFHNLLVLSTCGAKSGLLDLVGVEIAQLEAQAKAFDPTALTTNITILEELRRQMRSSQAGRALLDATLARLALSGQFSTIGEMVARLNGDAPAQKKKPEFPPLNRASGVVGRTVREETPAAPVASPVEKKEDHRLKTDATETPVAAVAAPAIAPTNDPPPTTPAPIDDSPDELPAVGKVAAEGATNSMWQAFKKAGAPMNPSKPGAKAAPSGPQEPPHLANLRNQVTEKLPGRHAAMFSEAKLLSYDDATGLATVYFDADHAAQAAYLKKHREMFVVAFGDVVGRVVEIRIEQGEEAVEAKPIVEDRKPKVIRPRLDEVAAEVKDEAPTPMVDVDAVKDDPLVAAVLRAFEGARIVKVE